MKRILFHLVVLTVAAAALLSCNRELEGDIPFHNSAITVKVLATAQESVLVKTYLGTYEGQERTVLWGPGEQMMLAVTSAGSSVFAASEKNDGSVGEASAEFWFTTSNA